MIGARRIARGALRGEIEVAQRRDLVAPQLEAHGIRHAEAVDVDDAAAHAELRDIVDERDALEADGLEMRDERVELLRRRRA